jgi:hypothetical protein
MLIYESLCQVYAFFDNSRIPYRRVYHQRCYLHRRIAGGGRLTFRLVERFLTCAVNVIGQEYLRSNVTAVLYDDPIGLHPNLRENLTQMCSKVTIQSKD